VQGKMIESNWGRGFRLLVVFFFGLSLTACYSPTESIPTSLPVETHTPSPSSTISFTPTLTDTQTPTITPSTISPSSTSTPVWPPEGWLIPDSEIVYSPSAVDFDVLKYLDQTKGFLSTYRQYLMITDWTTGADIVTRVALENSINPRLLLALLEYQSGCVMGQVDNPENFDTAMGASHHIRLDLYGQLTWAVHEISDGYYGWRTGALTEFSLADGTIVEPDPNLNAGTVALQYFFGQLYGHETCVQALDPKNGFPALYERMFGNPWKWAKSDEPLMPPGVEQPQLTLPFPPGLAWAYTGGPHMSFEGSGPLAALDFAPPTAETGCWQSDDWILAMTDGLVVRSELGVVIQDLDGDSHEQTGWAIMYLHIEERHRVPVGTYLKAGDQVGHPSCEGGRATGTHVHIARKYNGEWVPADGEIPFVLDGWTAHEGDAPYLGTLTRGDHVVIAHQFGSYISRIARDE